ncbi:MAG: hypothetical protein JST13_13850, partial [Bacteroidetes bacterium]|nr:hypothetical protein [Bacteroidota bacterium]
DDPLFWIAVGSIFYFITDVLVKSLVNLHEKNAEAEISGSRLLLDIANISRYFFYLLASFFYKGAGGEKKDDEFN